MLIEMYEQVMFSIENNLFEARLNSKESFRRAIALWKNLPQAKKEVEAKRILKAAKREGYTVKQKEILAYADEDISSMKAKKSVRRELRAKKKAKRDERFEQVKANVSDDEDIEDKTRIELLAIAIKKGIKTTPKMNRAELIDLLRPTKKEDSTNYELDYKDIKNKNIEQLRLLFVENIKYIKGDFDKQDYEQTMTFSKEELIKELTEDYKKVTFYYKVEFNTPTQKYDFLKDLTKFTDDVKIFSNIEWNYFIVKGDYSPHSLHPDFDNLFNDLKARVVKLHSNPTAITRRYHGEWKDIHQVIATGEYLRHKNKQ